jgi:hypothetical protein
VRLQNGKTRADDRVTESCVHALVLGRGRCCRCHAHELGHKLHPPYSPEPPCDKFLVIRTAYKGALGRTHHAPPRQQERSLRLGDGEVLRNMTSRFMFCCLL